MKSSLSIFVFVKILLWTTTVLLSSKLNKTDEKSADLNRIPTIHNNPVGRESILYCHEQLDCSPRQIRKITYTTYQQDINPLKNNTQGNKLTLNLQNLSDSKGKQNIQRK